MKICENKYECPPKYIGFKIFKPIYIFMCIYIYTYDVLLCLLKGPISSNFHQWRFPKSLGVLLFLGVPWGTPMLGNLHIDMLKSLVNPLVTTGDPLKTSPGGSRFRARRCRARWRSISSSSGSTLAENVGNVDHIKVTGNHTYVIHGLLYHLLWQAIWWYLNEYIYILCIYIYTYIWRHVYVYNRMST